MLATAPTGGKPSRSKLAWIALLYFAEGFPLGAFYDIFPVYFRQQGVELAKIGLLSLLGLAWTLKFVWAPAVEAARGHRYWMAACDLAMGGVMLAFAAQAGFGPWVWLAIGAFTLLSATNDIATDGYTIELLGHDKLGLANGVRNGAYRIGMLGAGGVLYLSDEVGWRSAYFGAAILLAALAAFVLFAPRLSPVGRPRESGGGSEFAVLRQEPRWIAALTLFVIGLAWPVAGVIEIDAISTVKSGWWFKAGVPVAAMLVAALLVRSALRRSSPQAEMHASQLARGPVFGALIELLARPGIVPVLLFILLFKLADSSMGFMVKPFWVDSGFSNKQIGLVSVNIGLGLAIFGGLVGGWYVDRVGVFKALWVLGLWQAVSNLGYAGVAALIPLQPQGSDIAIEHQLMMYSASAIESFTGGLGSAAFLAFLMAIVNKGRATTEYAILSSIFAFSRSLAGFAGGIGAQEMGYANYFFLTFFLAFPAYLLLPAVRRMLAAAGVDEEAAAPARV